MVTSLEHDPSSTHDLGAAQSTRRIYEFGHFLMDPFEQLLLSRGRPVHLTLKTFAVLRILVERNGHIVEKSEMMRQCWPDTCVEEANLPQTICMLRKTLGDHSHEYLETVSGRGYRFIASVRVSELDSSACIAYAPAEENLPEPGSEPVGQKPVADMDYLAEDFRPGKTRRAAGHSEHDEGHRLYLRGRHYWSQYTIDGLNKAIDYFRLAIKIDSKHSLAHLGLAECYYRLSNIHLSPRKAIPRAKASLVIALKTDETLAEAHALRALISAFFDHDWAAAETGFRRAIDMAPHSALPHKRYGWALGILGRFEGGVKEINRALNLEPESADIRVGLGIVLHLARRYDDAIGQGQIAVRIDPQFFPARVLLGIAYLQQGQVSRAISELQNAASLTAIPWILGYLGYAYAISGSKRQGLNVLADLKKRSDRSYVFPYAAALIHTGLGNKALALQSLQHACEDRNELVGFIKTSPEFDILQSEQGFKDLLHDIDLPTRTTHSHLSAA